MVLHKRLDYGFNGYQVPATPRAARSARRRSSFRKKVEDDKMCAFDLLATIAGKLLLERAGSPISSSTSDGKDEKVVMKESVKKEAEDENKLPKLESCDQHKCDGEMSVFEPALQALCSRDSAHLQDDAHPRFASVSTTSDGRFGAEKPVIERSYDDITCQANQAEPGSSGCGESKNCKLKYENDKQVTDESACAGKTILVSKSDRCSLEDPVICDGKPHAPVSSNSIGKIPVKSDHCPNRSFSPNRGDIKVVSRDDDENSSGCTHSSTATKSFRSSLCIGDRRIKKLFASKYWKLSPRLKRGEPSNNDGDMEPICYSQRNCIKRQRSQRNYPFKKRKIFHSSSVSDSDGAISNEGLSVLPEMGNNMDASVSNVKMLGGSPSPVAGEHPSYESINSHVKLRIKSFKVPELFIEIPETATVGSLKRTVMEALTSILGGGLRVGMLLQGKKVKDENKTLKQTGISHESRPDALGFTLEPNSTKTSQPSCICDPSHLPFNSAQSLTRYPASSVAQQQTMHALSESYVNNTGCPIESDHDSAPSPVDASSEKNTTDCKALVAVPAINVDALAVVPMKQKAKRSEVAQRRIRRPFSVAEVEALVQAVEKLGTGRWRDVKLRAFDNAKHRTYVDLKDKWKTLVHTAKISPQQRRGEPVPQELLDRVLTAHAYWSQQQAKQQHKQQSGPLFLV